MSNSLDQELHRDGMHVAPEIVAGYLACRVLV